MKGLMKKKIAGVPLPFILVFVGAVALFFWYRAKKNASAQNNQATTDPNAGSPTDYSNSGQTGGGDQGQQTADNAPPAFLGPPVQGSGDTTVPTDQGAVVTDPFSPNNTNAVPVQPQAGSSTSPVGGSSLSFQISHLWQQIQTMRPGTERTVAVANLNALKAQQAAGGSIWGKINGLWQQILGLQPGAARTQLVGELNQIKASQGVASNALPHRPAPRRPQRIPARR